MRIQIGKRFDLTVRRKAQDLITHLPSGGGGWFNVMTIPGSIKEAFAGAWQRNVTTPVQVVLQHPTVWTCGTLIASDIAKCYFSVIKEDAKTGIYDDVEVAAFSPVLRKPNHYQNRIQFNEQWAQSKLFCGNTYVLKGYDGRGVCDSEYILDANRVQPMVSPRGQVYYSVSCDNLAYDALEPLRDSLYQNDRGDASVVIPARYIIHDRWNTFFHPLVGLSPIFAAGHLAGHALRILANSSRLAATGFQPGGVVTSAEVISQENIDKFEKLWADNYEGPENQGKIVVLGGGLKFEKPPMMSAVDADIIKQLGWGDEKICAVFHVPGSLANIGPAPTDPQAAKLQYYSQCLQILVEAMELCQGEGIGAVDAGYEVKADVEQSLLRMDMASRMKFETDAIKGGVGTVNEGRKAFNRKPVKGGDTVYLQEQDHSVAWLAERDAMGPPPPVARSAPAPSVPAAAPPAPAKKAWDRDDLLIATVKRLEVLRLTEGEAA